MNPSKTLSLSLHYKSPLHIHPHLQEPPFVWICALFQLSLVDLQRQAGDMGRQGGGAGRGKKADKLGSGKVTPVQIAFIVERYLTQNHFIKTLHEFRQEAASILGSPNSKNPPKQMLGLADILDDYISLKEQRIILSQEKGRIDQLLQGLQDVIGVYQTGVGHTNNTQLPIASSPDMASSQVEAGPSASGSQAITPTPAPVQSSGLVAQRSNLPVPNNKRKNTSSGSNSNAPKRQCLAPKSLNYYPIDNVSQLPMPAQGFHYPYMATQASVQTVVQSRNVQHCPEQFGMYAKKCQANLAKQAFNQPSPASTQQIVYTSMPNDSSYPQTPPQVFPPQANGASPLESSVQMSVNSDNRVSSCINTASSDKPTTASKAKAQSVSKRESIKSKLDFTTSLPKSPIKTHPKDALENAALNALTEPVELGDVHFDISDLPSLDADFEKFMSDFLGIQGSECTSSDTVETSQETSIPNVDKHETVNETQGVIGCDATPIKEKGILTEKDTNIQVSNLRSTEAVKTSGTQSLSQKGGKNKDGLRNQENIPVCNQ